VEQLNENEFAALKKELSDIDEKALLSSAVGLFFGLLSDEHDTDAFPEIVQNIGRIMDLRMQGKDIRGAIQILEGLKGFLAVYNTPAQKEMLELVISRAGGIENLRVLFSVSQDIVEIRQYLLLLGTQSLTQMIQLLSELNDRKQRRLLCEILAEIGNQDIDTLAEALNDEKWYLVRNIVMILGMTKDPGSVKYLEKVSKHMDVRVRRETIRALEGISNGETKDLFIAALEDSDATVRIAALRALRRLKAPGLFEVLSRNISRDELRKKPFDEKKELLETIVVLGGEEAFPLLSELFKKKGLIEKDEITEIRASAAYGLGLLKSKEAILMLEKETNSKKSLLRGACIKALGKS
jgi:HEAT repeat protein